MNVLDLLNQEVNKMHLNEIEKIRYIYIRCCEIFSFDVRLYYAPLFDDMKTYEKIAFKTFDVTNVDTNLVVCKSLSKYLLNRLIEEIVEVKVDVKETDSHASLYVPKYSIDMDASLSDLARIKAGFLPLSFHSKKIHDDVFKSMDYTLGYTFLDDSLFSYKDKLISAKEFFKYNDKMTKMGANKYFSDADYFIMHHILFEGFQRLLDETYADKDYNFYEFYLIDNQIVCLSKENDLYLLKESNDDYYDHIRSTCKTRRLYPRIK